MSNNEKNILENDLENTVEIPDTDSLVEQPVHLAENNVETAEGNLIPNLDNPIDASVESLQEENVSVAEQIQPESVSEQTPLEGSDSSLAEETTLSSAMLREESVIKAASEPVGILDYLSDLIFDPASLGRNIKIKPKIILPMIFAAFLLCLSIIIPKGVMEQYVMDTARAQFPDAPIEMLKAQAQFGVIVAMITAPLGLIFVTLLQAAFLRWITGMFGGDGKYKHILSVLLFASILSCVGAVLASIGKLLTGNFFFDFSVLAFFGAAGLEKWYSGVLQILNPFSLWYYYVVVIGLREVNHIKTKAAVQAVAILIALGTLLGIGMQLVSSAF